MSPTNRMAPPQRTAETTASAFAESRISGLSFQLKHESLSSREQAGTAGIMYRLLGKYSPYLYALLRIIVGLMFAMHGSQKLFGTPGGGHAMPLSSLMG